MRDFQFRDAARFNADPQKVGKELDALAGQNAGKLTPPAVVEYAKDPKTEAHKCFQWDDTAAAFQFRLQQARQLVRSIEVITTDKGESRKEPLVVNVIVKGDDGADQHYSTPARIRSDLEEQAAARLYALSGLSAAKRRVEELETILSDTAGAARAKKGSKYIQRAAKEIEKISVSTSA